MFSLSFNVPYCVKAATVSLFTPQLATRQVHPLLLLCVSLFTKLVKHAIDTKQSFVMPHMWSLEAALRIIRNQPSVVSQRALKMLCDHTKIAALLLHLFKLGEDPTKLQIYLDAKTKQLHRLGTKPPKHPPQTELSCKLRGLVQE